MMLGFFKNAKLGLKLPLIMGVLVAATIIVMSGANAVMTRNIISSTASEKLESIALLKAKRIKALLESVDRDIRVRANAPATSLALIALADGYDALENPEEVLRRVYIEDNPHPLGEKDLLVKADTGSSYGFIHAIYHPSFDALQNEMDYYDIFLFDTQGNLVYSVFKENDYATNMLDGPWAGTDLAEAYRQAAKLDATDASVFMDFAPYGPSNDAPAAFIARPVFDQQGTRLGVLAYQMPVTQINMAAGDLEGLGTTADGFIVGPDRTLRSDAPQSEVMDILETVVDHPAITEALEGRKTMFSDFGHTGVPVMGFAAPIEFLGTEWVAVVQQADKELFAGLWGALYRALAISAAILFGAVALSIFFSRSISRPVMELTHAVNSVAEGRTDTVVPGTDRGDEIGELARKTEVFRQNAERIANMVEEQKAAHQRMSEMNADRQRAAEREIELAQEKERTDKAFLLEREEMMRDLGVSFGDVVTAALDGNFSQRVRSNFADDTLNELSSNINNLLASVEGGLTTTGDILERVAKGDLTQRMAGDFRGSFRDLQSHVNNMLDALTSLIMDITNSGETLSGSSAELRQTADMLSKQAEQNAASVEQTSAAIEELTASMSQVDANLIDVSQSAQQARKTAKDSERVASEAARSMDRILKGSKEINRVTDVIEHISFQINLLALNAGVEAARAGDAGLGFTVVASEVRQLAQRAGDAVQEIAQVLNQSDAAVQEGVANVSKAKASLDEISTKVVSISESVEDVTRAMSEQASGIQEISSAVSHVDGNTQRQAAAFEEITASSHLLANEAQELKKSTSRFHIDAPSKSKALTPHDSRDGGAQNPTNTSQELAPDSHGSDGWGKYRA